MARNTTHKTFHLNAVFNGHLIAGVVRVSPAPAAGIFTALARFEAERLLTELLCDEIAAGRLGTPSVRSS